MRHPDSFLWILLKHIICLPAVFAALQLCAAQPGEAFADFTADGGWCWFSNPRAVSRDGKTYTGWVTADGSVQAAQLDHASGQVTTVNLHERYGRDDHDNPAFVFLPDGRLMAFYSQHGGGRHPAIHSRTTTRPGVFTEWTPEVALPLKDDSGGKAGISYCNPHLLAAETNTLYLFWRGYTFKPTMSKSTDGGKTWTPAQVVFSRPGYPPGNRPYAQYASNGKDRIHLLFTDGHPRNEASNSVYYACYRAGAFYKADGIRICGGNELPIRPEQADCVYDAKKTGARAWVWDIAFDKNENPVVAYTRLPEETDHRYHYARWDGKQWQDTELCAGGGWFPQTPAGKKEPEPHYSSGLALDHSDPSVVFLSRPVNGVREIEKWVTADGGKSWKSEAVTANSKFDNIRPVVVRHHAADGPTVLWMNLHGGYIHFTDYHTAIKMDRPANAVAATFVPPLAPSGPSLSSAIAPQAVLTAMERVADWQLANPSKHKPTDWTQGAGYAGIMALAQISGSTRFWDAMVRVGETNDWKLGPRRYHADDHCVGQSYAELFLKTREPRMIAPMRAQFDEILAAPPKLASFEFKQKDATSEWTWCDALFMSPASWVRLTAVTGDARYSDFAVTNWWRTSDFLYDKEEHLYFRDSTYFTKREANGRKVFWSRGNGWVIGGLVRVLQDLPKNHPAHARFETQFKEMCAKLLACQQPDGLWRSSLLDPESYPLKETSGTGFYVFGLAWGVNQGLLDRATFEPAVRKGWAALVGCVAEDGKLTHVQPIGADPKKFSPDATEVYGVGAFLLAGSEVYRLAVTENAKPQVVTVTNPADFSRACETIEIAAPAKPVAVLDDATSRLLDSQVVGDKLLFQSDFSPRETRKFLLVDAARFVVLPKPMVKTFARFVPERMDDFAWESDRIAHRMYGPALITGEGTISSGVDVWVKSTRRLVIDKWYALNKYHADHGEGLDCYSVSHGKAPTRGCGGLGVWQNGRLYASRNFKSWKLIATGPVRSVFELTYDAWDAGGRKVSEVKRISIDAGSNFSRVESTFTADGQGALNIAVGIAKRDGVDAVTPNAKEGWLAYAEPEQDKNGRIYCGLIFSRGVNEFTKDEVNSLAIALAQPGKPFVYHLGAGWSKSGDFADAAAWTAHVGKVAARLKAPLQIAAAK